MALPGFRNLAIAIGPGLEFLVAAVWVGWTLLASRSRAEPPRRASDDGSGGTAKNESTPTLREIGLAAAIYAILTTVLTWPLLRTPASRVLDPSGGWLVMDVYLVLWILASVTRSLATDPSTLFDGRAFHPFPLAIARSEHLLGDQPLFAPIYLATGNAVLGMNVAVATSFVAGALAMHLLVRSWTGRHAAAFVAAIAWSFAAWRMDLGRPHILQTQWLPLAILFLDRSMRTGRLRDGMACAALLGLQFLCSFYLAYAAAMVAACFVLGRLAITGLSRRGLIAAGLGLAGAALLLLATSLPYLELARSRAIPAYVGGATPSGGSALAKLASATAIASLLGSPFLSFSVLLLAALLAILRPAAPLDGETRARILGALLAILVGFVLSMGPRPLGKHWIDPWAWAGALIPGFAQMRVPTRMMIGASFGASVTLGFGFAALEAGITDRRVRTLLATLAAAILFGPALRGGPPLEVEVPTRDSLPPVYDRLRAATGRGAVLELPMGSFFLEPQLFAARAMYLGTFHDKPVINGYSGFPPVGYAVVEARARKLPDRNAVEDLARCADLRWVVDHGPSAPGEEWMRSGFRLVGRFRTAANPPREDMLWELPRRDRGPCPTGFFDLPPPAPPSS